jgi:hypothetical protein
VSGCIFPKIITLLGCGASRTLLYEGCIEGYIKGALDQRICSNAHLLGHNKVTKARYARKSGGNPIANVANGPPQLVSIAPTGTLSLFRDSNRTHASHKLPKALLTVAQEFWVPLASLKVEHNASEQ